MKRSSLYAGVQLLAGSVAQLLKGAMFRNAFVHKLALRHPATFVFFANRFDRGSFQGMTLTALAVAFFYLLALFAGLIEDVLTLDPIVNLDHAVVRSIAVWRTPDVVSVFVWITSLGNTPVVVVLICVACGIAWLCNRGYAIAGLLVANIGASTLSTLSKLTFQRARPLEAALLEMSYSFPSGHATIAVAFYGSVGYLVIRSASSYTARFSVLFGVVAIALLLGLSRIVLGVHYLSDVMGGYLVGSMGLVAGIGVMEWLTDAGRMNWHAAIGRSCAVAATALLAAAAGGFAGYLHLQGPH